MSSSFKGIWMPVELIHMDISWTKKILFAEISQLETLDQGCIATNKHFSEKFALTRACVSKALNEMAKDGIIIIDNSETHRNFGRQITINLSTPPINLSIQSVNSGLPPINSGRESKGRIHLTNKELNKKNSGIDFTCLGLPDEDIAEVLRIRKQNKGGVLSQRAVNGLGKQFALSRKRGFTNDDILTKWDVRGWKSFEDEWMGKPANPIREKSARNWDAITGGANNEQSVIDGEFRHE